jgi:hypothetical protein
MSRRLVAATAVALLFLLYSARASAQSGGIWIAGGVSSTGGGRIATDYEPPLLFGLQGVSRATQTVDVDRATAPHVEVGAQWFPTRHVGLEAWVSRERAEEFAPSSTYDTTLTYISRPPPDNLPRQSTYAQQTDWPPVRVAMRRWTAGVNIAVRPVLSTRVAWTISGGLSRIRVSGDVEPLGFTSFVLGGHSVLFPNEYLLNTRLEPAWAWRANAGTMLDVSLAEHLALTMGARAVVGDDLHPSVRVTGVDLSRAGFEPPPVEEITERLSSTSVNASTTSLRLLAGLKVVF